MKCINCGELLKHDLVKLKSGKPCISNGKYMYRTGCNHCGDIGIKYTTDKIR